MRTIRQGGRRNGVNELSNPPTLTRRDLSLFRGNLNTIRRWAARGTADTQQVPDIQLIFFFKFLLSKSVIEEHQVIIKCVQGSTYLRISNTV